MNNIIDTKIMYKKIYILKFIKSNPHILCNLCLISKN